MKASLNIRKATGDGSTSPPFSFWVWRGIGRAYTFFPKRVLTVCNDPTTLRNTQESLLQRYRPGSWYFTGLRGGVMDRDSNTHVNITHVWQDNESVKTKTLLTLNGSIHSNDLSRLTPTSDESTKIRVIFRYDYAHAPDGRYDAIRAWRLGPNTEPY